jgi:hypothetical protein
MSYSRRRIAAHRGSLWLAVAHRNLRGLAQYQLLLAVAHRGSRATRGDLLWPTGARKDSRVTRGGSLWHTGARMDSQLLAVEHWCSRFSRSGLLWLIRARRDSTGYSQLFAVAHRVTQLAGATRGDSPWHTETRGKKSHSYNRK